MKERRKGPFPVIGVGPAGLQAALTIREAGDEVCVVERAATPGGKLKAASKPDEKEPYAEWVDWVVRRLRSMETRV
ncbi:MAG: NAD(P)/FAD-dependent oxidoreductase [Actinomycetota bacterium]|nr:NAD(P)/FAD-dependent oxidoreductase [Actinomycetota bacterium]